MIDLSGVLEQVPTSAAWTSESAYTAAVEGIQGAPLELDWDEHAGESWISLLAGDVRAGMISTIHPLAVIIENEDGVAVKLVGRGVRVVIVPSFDDVVLTCATEKLEELFGSPARILGGKQAFSANDLWFATI